MDKKIYASLALLVVIALGTFLYANRSENKENDLDIGEVIINNVRIAVEIATSSEAQQKGLSGRASLEENNGMFFIFSHPDYHRFWMPDMLFPIDIIWIRDGKVVDISANVSNEFDPKNPRHYSPKEPAQYVLEANAGFAEKKNIKTGDKVILQKING